ncbi:glycosyltransferase (plasmid) [Rhizobium sp. WYJ-E13]|nr:glycosyltransferase [Rhizobium sp. WYJ-E13]
MITGHEMDAKQSADNKVWRITVAVLTYRRPEGIVKLLDSLTRQERHPARPYHMTVLVVDNDATESSRDIVEGFDTKGVFDIVYAVEPRQGIPVARNHAMDKAPQPSPETGELLDPDYFCFLDDDEWATEGWMDAMLDTCLRQKADCVYGYVVPVYPENAPEYWVKARVFESARNQEGGRIDYAASNNVMFDYKLVKSWNLRFEEKMLNTGGTDYLFFNQAVKLGMKIVWTERAMVYDIIPLKRMTWKWVLQRQYRLGNTFAVSEVLHGNRKQRLYRLIYGITRTGLGVAMLPTLAVSPYLGMRALTHLLRGAGVVTGLFGHFYQEYQPPKEAQSSAAS